MHEYKDYHKLICKMAWKMHYRTGIEVDEFISEFNLVFVESDISFEQEKHISFVSYLCGNIMRRFSNIMLNKNRLKNRNLILVEDLPHTLCYDLMDSIIIRDSFFKSDNPVIFSIAELICSNPLPDGSVKTWLREKLRESGYRHKQISDAFSILRDVIDPEGKC